MKITCTASDLRAAMEYVKGAVQARTTIPVLEHVRIDASAGRIEISATDLQVYAAVTCAADVHISGTVMMPGHLMASILAKAPKAADVTIDCTTDSHRAAVTVGRAQYDVATLGADEFPEPRDAGDGSVSWVMPAAALKAAIEATAASVETGDRKYLQGVCVDQTDGLPTLHFTATDGHRLVSVAVDAPDGCVGLPTQKLTIPAGSLRMVTAICDIDSDIAVTVSPTRLVIVADDRRLSSVMLGTEYPDWRRLVPRDAVEVFRVAADVLSDAVNRTAVVIAKDGMARGVRLTCSGDGLEIAADAVSGNSATETIEIESGTAEASVKVNARYLLDYLAQWGDGVVSVSVASSGGPILLRSASKPGLTQVIMPTR